MDDIEIKNKDNLRVVKTIRNDVDALNIESKQGNHILTIKTEPNEDFIDRRMLLKNKKDGSIVDVTNRNFFVQYGEKMSYPFEEWDEILTYKDYQGYKHHLYEWGSYIVPKDAKKGELFYIEDIIQDIVAQRFWGSILRAKDGYAKWDGRYLEIDESLYEDYDIVG